MEAAGLTGKTPDPPGGEILKDATGRPIGLLRGKLADITITSFALLSLYDRYNGES